ncbi:MAG: zinc-binding alcohol dehydrogenase [Clostridia bacterium]|nr:zinc-binding alcohol dehydrogenase [Clostridia bacterium]
MEFKQIVFTEKNKAELLTVDLKEPAPNEVMVETMVSTISCGTERANITGDPNVNAYGASQVVFPRASGYNSSGVVVKKGSNVKSVEIGDRVVVFWGQHKNYNIVPEERIVKIENDSISFETGAMSFISTFPMAAIRKTRLEIGESAIVMGLGILGMIAVKLLRAAGAVPIIAADPNPKRREIALQNGADYVFDPLCEGFADKVKNVTGGGVNVAIEVTGVGAGFNEALDCMAKFGRVALLGCTRNSDFTVDYYKKIHAPGITVIGAHTLARPDVESHPGWFTHRDDIKTVLKLCGGNRLCLDNIIEETHSPKECPEVYNRLIYDKNFPIVVQFDWRRLK